MPGFVSHTVMAYDIYHKLKQKNVNLNYLVTYSLGGDLCKYAKCRYASHHKDQEKFILNMVQYIKDNNLGDDMELMGVLYGHIAHYMMDDMLHPLIRKVDKLCLPSKQNHTLIEEYYDGYLVEERLKISKKEFLKRNILKAKVDRKIAKMLDYVYLETYNTKHIARYYRFNLMLYRLLRKIYLLFGKNLIEKISGLTSFLKDNQGRDFVNNDRVIEYKVDDKMCNDSLNGRYEKCLARTISYISKINV